MLLPAHAPSGASLTRQIKGLPDVFGLVHKSEVTWARILTVDEVLKLGEWKQGVCEESPWVHSCGRVRWCVCFRFALQRLAWR